MIPPTDDSVRLALDILVEHIRSINSLTPIGDTITLSKILEHAEVLQLAALHVQQEVKSQITNLHSAWKAYAPFLHLPVDVFIRIVYYSLGDQPSPFKRLRELCLVAKMWRSTIRAAPELWGFISDVDSEADVEGMLRRSADAALHIKYTGTFDFSSKVLPHSHRWHSLHISYPRLPGVTPNTLLAAHTPHLSDLYLFASSRATDIPTAILGTGRNLLDVRIWGVNMKWDTPRLSGLRSLRLSRIFAPPSIERVLEVLVESPRLTTLNLTNFEDVGYDPPPHDSFPTIHLPCLTRLALQDLPTEYCAALLARIQAPNCTNFVLMGLPKFDCGIFVPDNNFVCIASQFLIPGRKMELRMDGNRIRLLSKVSGGFLVTATCFDRMLSLITLASFLSMFDLTMDFTIKAAMPPHEGNRPEPFPVEVLDLFPPVTNLLITGDFKPFLRYLSLPQGPDGDGYYTWPCMSLQELHIQSEKDETSLDADTVLRFLHGRWGNEHGFTFHGNQCRHPPKLRQLTFELFTATPTEVMSIFTALDGRLFSRKTVHPEQGAVRYFRMENEADELLPSTHDIPAHLELLDMYAT
ncbi:hypothetical protein FRB99_001819 [Tulasnella sp. 403]|nr:hypothetical protein FRB99_001819 [Tulasnella sp. 403]